MFLLEKGYNCLIFYTLTNPHALGFLLYVPILLKILLWFSMEVKYHTVSKEGDSIVFVTLHSSFYYRDLRDVQNLTESKYFKNHH